MKSSCTIERNPDLLMLVNGITNPVELFIDKCVSPFHILFDSVYNIWCIYQAFFPIGCYTRQL